jgi:hypothetical protein
MLALNTNQSINQSITQSFGDSERIIEASSVKLHLKKSNSLQMSLAIFALQLHSMRRIILNFNLQNRRKFK